MTLSHYARLSLFALAAAVAACSGSTTTSTPVVTPTSTPTSSPGTAPASTFATVASAPTQLSGANQNVTLPSVPGATAGGSIVVTASGPVTTVLTTASAASAGSAGGPPAGLQSMLRHTKGFGGVNVTPQYYVGVTNSGSAPTQVNFGQLNLNVNVPSGQAPALAHYDPSYPQNGWNQHCAFGNGQVTQNGNSTQFNPGGSSGANITVYPGATIWFAPYTYPTTNSAPPTPPPASTAVTPTPAPAPASLTGTYVGSAQQTSPSSQGSQYIEFQLTQSGSSLSGKFALMPGSNNQNGAFGTISGSVSGSSVNLTFSDQYGQACTGTLQLTASGALLSGTFATSNNTQNCNGSGVVSANLQSAALPVIAAATYSGTITDSKNGQGTMSYTVTDPGTVFSGTATVNWPSNAQAGGTSAVVGFVTSTTQAFFAVIGDNGGSSGNNSQNCSPTGTITISGKTLSGSYSGSGGGGSANGCTGTGSFSITSP